MENNKLYAIIVVAVLIVAGVGAFFLMGSSDSEYRSTNTDGRLTVLGNANEDDYLDNEDIDTLEKMIGDGKYTTMADANNDGEVDQKDINMVKKIIEVVEYNDGKSDSDKKSATINYITVDGNIQSAKIPVLKMIVLNSERALSLSIAIDVADRIVALNDYIFSAWDKNFFDNYKDLPSVGDRKEPSIEEILKTDADTIYTGISTTYGKNFDGYQIGDKQVIRLATWESGGLENGALMLGFFTGNNEEAQKYVKWMDDLNKEISGKLKSIDDPSATRFYIGTPTYMYAGNDGVATAFSATGATNVGGALTAPGKSGMSTSSIIEDILVANPQYIIAGATYYTHMSFEEVKAKYDGYNYSKFAITDGYKNGEMFMVNYGMPFCIQTMLASHILFDLYTEEQLGDKIQDYLDKFTEADDYDFQLCHFLYIPA